MKRIVCSYLFKRTSESTHPKQIPFYHLTRCPNYKNKKRSWMPISPSPLREWLLSLSPGLHSHCPCFFPGVPYLSPCYQSCSVPMWPPRTAAIIISHYGFDLATPCFSSSGDYLSPALKAWVFNGCSHSAFNLCWVSSTTAPTSIFWDIAAPASLPFHKYSCSISWLMLLTLFGIFFVPIFTHLHFIFSLTSSKTHKINQSELITPPQQFIITAYFICIVISTPLKYLHSQLIHSQLIHKPLNCKPLVYFCSPTFYQSASIQ